MTDKKTIKCPVCKKENGVDAGFCSFCRYPINIKKIDELTKKDLAVCFDSFLEVISKKRKQLFKNKELQQTYDELLSINWLRPESALFRFVETEILFAIKNKCLKYPMLDMGCGDGLFTSILFGGKINKKYDAYSAIDFSQKDIYNNFRKIPADFFEKKPSRIGFGLDIKKNSALMASALKVYDQVKTGDARKLPFGNESVNSVFSNMIDDIKNEDLITVFKEANRVLKPNGCLIFTTPTERFKEFLFYRNKAEAAIKKGNKADYARFMELDRGRSFWESRPMNLWNTIFKETSFEMVGYTEYGNSDFVQFWDTGFRPFFSHLASLRNALLENILYLPAKKVFMEIIREYIFKFAEGQINQKGAFAIITVKKHGKRK